MKQKNRHKLIKNKKAIHEFMIILMVTVIIAFASLIIILNKLVDDSRVVGEAAGEVMVAAQKGDDLANYVDVGAKQAVRQTEYEFALKGGMLSPECGSYNNANFWYEDGKLCLPTKYKEDFKSIMASKLDSYISSTSSYFNLPQNNYDLNLLPEKVIGVARQEVSVEGSVISVPGALNYSYYSTEQATSQTSLAQISPSADTVSIVFGGDATTLDKASNPFANILQFTQDSLFFVNLETLITTQEYTQEMIAASKVADNSKKKYHMRVLPEHAEYLSISGVDIANVANNHADDFGAIGLTDTMNYLEQKSIAFCGATKIPQQRQPTIITSSNGIKIGFVCYTEYVNSGTLHQGEKANKMVWIYNNAVQQDIAQARSNGADIVIVSIHAGTTDIVADSFQTDASRKAIDYGADLVIGHGAHRVQGIEFIEKDGRLKPIVYGLGNLVAGKGIENPDVSKLNTAGEAGKAILFSIEIDKNANVLAYKVIPLSIPTSGIPEPADAKLGGDIISNVISRSSSYKNGYKQDLVKQASVAGMPSQISINSQDCTLSTFSTNSESLGYANFGKVKNPAMIQKDSQNYDANTFSRGRNYGTNELIAFIEKTGCITTKALNTKIKVHDLSDKDGGEQSGHGSHQSGRDVDFGLYLNKNGQLESEFESAIGSNLKYFYAEANWILLKAMFASADIDIIFLDQQLIDKLAQYAQQNEQDTALAQNIFSKLKHYKNHHHHYHVRIKCPQDDQMCMDGTSDGSKQLLAKMEAYMLT